MEPRMDYPLSSISYATAYNNPVRWILLSQHCSWGWVGAVCLLPSHQFTARMKFKAGKSWFPAPTLLHHFSEWIRQFRILVKLSSEQFLVVYTGILWQLICLALSQNDEPLSFFWLLSALSALFVLHLLRIFPPKALYLVAHTLRYLDWSSELFFPSSIKWDSLTKAQQLSYL